MRSSFLSTPRVFLYLIVIVLASSLVALTECPKCYSNQTPMAGHGPAPDGSGRRLINVKIDSTWGNPTDSAIWNQTTAATDGWNNATDQYGNKTGYYMVLNQTATPDYIITKGTLPTNVCASVGQTGQLQTLMMRG